MKDQPNESHTISKDGFEEMKIDDGALWGKQTQRSLKYFDIGSHRFKKKFIDVLVTIKQVCAQVNLRHNLITIEQYEAIEFACKNIISSDKGNQFPLSVWQTGSGTQTNMNVNEVVSSLANIYIKDRFGKSGDITTVNVGSVIHPNDHVNLSQSSNDVFPTAMHIVVAQQTHQALFQAIEQFESELLTKQSEFESVYTVGRTHLMDAMPIQAGAVISGYLSQLVAAKESIQDSLDAVYALALGGTAVGSGANSPPSFGLQAIALLADHYQLPLKQHSNLYAAVSGEDALLRYSSALKQIGSILLKIANDFRLLGSGPRCGLDEWHLPANEAGSSIMPGKVNPTQCEALSMVCLQVFGNDLTVSLSASSGQLQLNTYRPVIIHNVLESIDLLSGAMVSFSEHCIRGLSLNRDKIDENMRNNLSSVTLLAPKLGYDTAAKIVQLANEKGTSLAVAAESLGLYTREQFESLFQGQLSAYLSSLGH